MIRTDRAPTLQIERLSVEFAADSLLVLADLDGCLVSDGCAHPEAPAFVQACKDRLWVVSNNSTHTAASMSDELASLGLEVEADRILLAGEQTLCRLRDLMAATPKLGQPPIRPAVPKTEPVLKVRGLLKSFHQGGGLFKPRTSTQAVKSVSFEIRPGETLGLVGESGCGKSTLARALMCLIEPDAGTVTLEGHDITGLDAAALGQARRSIQMVFQDPFASLNPRMTVRDLITEPAYLHSGLSPQQRAELAGDLLEKVTLERDAANRYPHQFSGGQRQRLSIARALSVSSKVIVADEAVSALDVLTAARVTALMQDIQDRLGVAFLFVGHDIAVVERVSHRIAVMYRGEIVEIGPTEQILRTPQHDYIRKLLSAVPVPYPKAKRAQKTPEPAV